MRVLITGGLGFIGSHLAEALTADEHELIILDDLSTGKREHAPKGARVIIDDVVKTGVFDDLVKEADVCFHLAAIASVERSRKEWRRAHEVNASGIVNLLDAIRRENKKIPVVFASSAAVYGTATAFPLSETTGTEPISSYGVDKLACEWHGRIAQSIHGIPTIGLRFFNVYGPRQDPSSPYSGVISIFMERILKGEPITVYGDGAQTRDFIHVSDIVSGLRLAMEALQRGICTYGVFNMCTGKTVSVLELAEIIGKVVGKTPDIDFKPERRSDIRLSCGDPSLATSMFGFESKITLHEGLKDLCKWR